MTISPDLSTEEGRLASFDAVHSAPKRRASAASAKSSKAMKWPHSSPSPAKLAKAGFYYKPTPTHVDNVACFMCQKALDGWEEDDDPIAEHLHHSENCGWAICVAVLERCDAEDLTKAHPLSQRMLEARRATFQSGWPHEKKKGWIPKIEKMIAAGWHFSPSTEPGMEDLVTCAYCALSLDGWEPKDDPMTEHQRRQSDCVFFSLAAQPNEEVKKAPVKRGRASKVSRSSVQSEINLPTAESSFIDPAVEGDSVLSVQSKDNQTAMARKGAKGKARKGSVASGKARTTRKKDQDSTENVVYGEPEDADFDVKVTAKGTGKRGKKRGSDQMDGNGTEDDMPLPKKRATRTRASSVLAPSKPEVHGIDSTEMADLAPPKTRGKAVRGKAAARTSTAKNRTASVASTASLRMQVDDDEDIDQALEEDLDRMELDGGDDVDMVEEPKTNGRKPAKAKAGSKKKAASVAPVRIADDSVITDTNEIPQAAETEAQIEELIEAPKVKAAKAKKTAKGAGKSSKKALGDVPSSANRADMSAQLETPASPAIRAAARMLLGSSPVYALPQPKGRAKRANSRQTSRQAPGKNTRISALSMTDSNVAPSSDHEVSAISVQDDSGHDTDASTASQSTVRRRGANKHASNAKRGKATKKAGPASRKIEDILSKPAAPQATEIEQDNDQEMLDAQSIQPKGPVEEQVTKNQPPATKASKAKPRNKAAKVSTTEEVIIQATAAESPASIAAIPTAVEKPAKKTRKVTAPKPKAVKVPVVHQAASRTTPSPSPQSSDAENQPPSSRPLAPASTNVPRITRVPISASTPQSSPSKRNLINGRSLKSATEWTALDLETVFLQTPHAAGAAGKENAPTHLLDNALKGALTSPEKNMTVEEWIKFNAKLGEERLRSECERVVGVFEREGNRAVAVLEGIEVVVE